MKKYELPLNLPFSVGSNLPRPGIPHRNILETGTRLHCVTFNLNDKDSTKNSPELRKIFRVIQGKLTIVKNKGKKHYIFYKS